MDEFFQSLPKNEQVISRRLRTLILDADPGIREQFSYGVPYYFRKRRICFVWPQSSQYGPKDALVSLGFCYGHMLSNEQGVLLSEGRSQVYIIKYSSLNDINEPVINALLQEALMVDHLAFSQTKKRKR